MVLKLIWGYSELVTTNEPLSDDAKYNVVFV